MFMTNPIKITLCCTFLFFSSINVLQSKPFESTYQPLPAEKILITNASIYDGDGNEFKNTDVLVQDGKIIAIGEDLPVPEDFRIIDANIISPNVDLKKLLIKKNQDKKKFEIEKTTDLDKTNMFFQEIFINGGKILINKKIYEVIGPIDSKVRLEYLFCTGEMFLPNYEKNR